MSRNGDKILIKKKSSFFLPSIAWVFFLLLFLKLSTSSALLVDGDTGWHVKTGEYILDTMSVPRYDIFSSLSPAPPWTAHEWLSELIMGLIHRASGLTGIVIFYALLISTIYYLFFKIIREQTSNIIIAVAIVLLVISSSGFHWLARPHIFTLLFTIIWYYLLDSYQYKNKNYLAFLPPLMLVWANLHLGFIFGFILIVIYFALDFLKLLISRNEERQWYRQRTKFLGITTLFCILASLVNPYGYHILLFPFKFMSMKFMIDHIEEFRSPNFHGLAAISFEMLMLYVILIFTLSKRRPNIIEFVVITLFAHMALYSVRNIPLFGIIVGPILARLTEYTLKAKEGIFVNFLEKRSNNITSIDVSARGYFWLVIPIIIITGAALGKINYRFDEKVNPVAAVEFLKRENITGNMYNDYEFGDYIIYSSYPQYKVFIDGRAEMYGTESMREYFKIEELRPRWEEILERRHINLIMSNSASLLSKLLLEKKEWRLIYSDTVANIFLKKLPENRQIINKYDSTIPATVENKDNDST